MKKIIINITLCILLIACGKNGVSGIFSQTWKIIEQRPDSARALLAKIDIPSLTDKEQAEYGLLMTMVDIKTRHNQIQNDSMISSSIRYYDKYGDKWHKAMAYHYRGVVKYALKNVPEAIKDLKKAESLAETLDDELLRNKIYERLAYCNYKNNNFPLVLKYSKKLLDSSKKMNDSMMVARSYTMVASGFANMEEMDSARIYILNSLDWIDAVDSLTQNEILCNVAAMYQETGEVEKAEQYLTDWVLNHANGFGYITLAHIRQKQGKYEEAVTHAKKSLECMDQKNYIHSLELLAELYSQMGDSSQAYAMQRRSKEFTDSLASANKASQMADWQMKFDEQKQEKKFLRQFVKLGGGVIVVFILLAIAIIWWNQRRIRHLRTSLDENMKQLTHKRERISVKLLMGAKLFNHIKEQKPLDNASANDLQCLVEYFAQLRPKRWQEWQRQYADLSTAQYVFLILQDDLHYNDETTATILNIKRISVRSMRLRIKRKGIPK
jgi:tetratricopeptide (TPR) repeat protein